MSGFAFFYCLKSVIITSEGWGLNSQTVPTNSLGGVCGVCSSFLNGVTASLDSHRLLCTKSTDFVRALGRVENIMPKLMRRKITALEI